MHKKLMELEDFLRELGNFRRRVCLLGCCYSSRVVQTEESDVGKQHLSGCLAGRNVTIFATEVRGWQKFMFKVASG